MSKSRWVVTIAIASTLGVLGWLLLGQKQQNDNLQQENASLKQQLARLSEVETDNQRLSNLVAQADGAKSNQQLLELLRLRNEVGVLRRLTNEFQPMQAELVRLRSAEVAGLGGGVTNVSREPLAIYPKDQWAFMGTDTPENAFQSLNWAALNGDLGTLKSNLTQEAQKEFAKAFENKSEVEIREELTRIFNEKVDARILSKNVISDNLVVLKVSDGRDGDSVDKLVFQKIDGQWKYVMDH
ncbi:MAG: hypothetical protein QM813_04555 [Verrucomicrobiota bacterium]